MNKLNKICSANFGEKTFSSWDYLNSVKTSNLDTLFRNLNFNLQIFYMIPATITRAKFYFSMLNIKLRCIGGGDRTCRKY